MTINGDVILDPSLDVWFGKVYYEFEEEYEERAITIAARQRAAKPKAIRGFYANRKRAERDGNREIRQRRNNPRVSNAPRRKI